MTTGGHLRGAEGRSGDKAIGRPTFTRPVLRLGLLGPGGVLKFQAPKHPEAVSPLGAGRSHAPLTGAGTGLT